MTLCFRAVARRQVEGLREQEHGVGKLDFSILSNSFLEGYKRPTQRTVAQSFMITLPASVCAIVISKCSVTTISHGGVGISRYVTSSHFRCISPREGLLPLPSYGNCGEHLMYRSSPSTEHALVVHQCHHGCVIVELVIHTGQ